MTWLTLFRTVATTLLLGATVARLLSGPAAAEFSRDESASFFLIALVYILTLIYGLVLRRGTAGRGVAYAQVLGDVLLATSLVYLTGGADSPFTFAYSIAVVAASILLYQRGALIAAMASSVAFATLIVVVQIGLVRAPPGSSVLPTGRLMFLLVSNVLAQFLIAALASYLARQLSMAGGQLSAREADLRELVDLQNRIVEAIPSGLITTEADGCITFVNPAAVAILGIDGPAARGRPIEEFIPDVHHVKPGTRRAELLVHTGGGPRIIGLAVTTLEGKKRSTLIVFQDLTDLRRAEDEMRRVDHLASLGKLSAQLAHEIRNPLASMRGSAQMLAGEARSDDASKRLANILIRESDRLATLVDDFLRFARPGPPELMHQDLKLLVAETVEMLRADPMAGGIEIELALEDVQAQVDPAQIRQVLINLLRNAFAAVGAGGRVVVRVARQDGQARIGVWDSAGSIPPSDLTRIFDPFFTTRKNGTGLGLSTAHSIIQAHGGMIHVRSSPSEGTEFVVGLPAQGEAHVANSGR
ncbi:MAG: two-component system sensor histidine kinase NtrB [Myxococcaceae bacterium]